MVRSAIVLIAALLAGCGTANTSRAPTLEPSAAGSVDPTACGHPVAGEVSGFPHDAPDLEARLPEWVGGRRLIRWSLDGWCWVRTALPESAIPDFKQTAAGESLDVAEMQYAMAGRSNVDSDPPYAVHVMWKPLHEATGEMTLVLFLVVVGVLDPLAFHPNLSPATIGGKDIYILDPEFLAQDQSQAGSAYVYDTEDFLYAVITDDVAWAADALEQLE